jgi:hypothetical protein
MAQPDFTLRPSAPLKLDPSFKEFGSRGGRSSKSSARRTYRAGRLIVKRIYPIKRCGRRGRGSVEAFKRGYDTGKKCIARTLSLQEKRGLILFIGKASCSQCHNGRNLTDNKFYNLGASHNDLGRFTVTRVSKDKGAFKTPTLRNIALTMPYMHDGSLKSLEEVVELYDRGGGTARNKSDLILKLNLTQLEKSDLMAFLKTLTGTIPLVSTPRIPEAE